MIVLIFVLYILFIVFNLVINKKNKSKRLYVLPNKKQKSLIKYNSKIKSFRIIFDKLFCSKNSQTFKLFKKLNRGLYIFDKQIDCENCLKILKDAGIEETLPLLKYELYENKIDFNSVYYFLKSVKNLDNKEIEFNLFIFFNDYINYKKIIKLVKYFKFNFVKVRIYNCCEIDYKLLSVINRLDLNLSLCNLSKKFKNSNTILLNKNYFVKKDCIEGCYISLSDEVLVPNYYGYKEFSSFCNIICKSCEVNVIKRYDYKNDVNLYKINIKNLLGTMQSLDIGFGKVFNEYNIKNSFYCLNRSKQKFELFNALNYKKSVYLGNFDNCESYKNCVDFLKNIKLNAFESKVFYFGVSNCNKVVSLENYNIVDRFESNKIDYLCIKTPNVVSSNKLLNYLLNEFLVSKIIEKMITKGNCLDKDFISLLDMKFDVNKLDKSFTERKFNSYFLIQKDFFKAYFNLLYYYFGMWQDKSGVNLNPDKSKLENNCKISLNFDNKILKFNLKNNNLKNEIQLNNIKYSNLKYLNLLGDKFKGNIDLLY